MPQAESPSKLNTEVWLPVPGHQGYEVSDQGRVKGRRGTILKPKIAKKGFYRLVWIKTDEDLPHTKKVHHLVLDAFVGPRPSNQEACHGDGDPGNNALTNLRWGTKSANTLDRQKHGTDFQRNKTHCPKGHPLVPGNLVKRDRNHRSCLKCHSARRPLST